MLKVLLLSRYSRLAASTRYRFCQYLPYLESQGISVTEAPFWEDEYLRTYYAGGNRKSPAYFLKAYSQRLAQLFSTRKYDLIWIYLEALPWIPAWLEILLLGNKTPYLVDYDDAWFHCYDQHPSTLIRHLLKTKIDHVMQRAALVVAGNEYIAARAEQARAKRIEILPTVVDLTDYPLSPEPNNEMFTIGWIGTPPTVRQLKSIHPALRLVSQHPQTRVVAIGDESLQLEGVNLEARPWNPATEVQELQSFDVGIMPLIDSVFERGKCGFKLIQYMACARPVVASPIGVNQQLVRHGENGFQALTTEEWLQAFQTVRETPDKGRTLGRMGRAQVEQQYSLQVTAPKMAKLLQQAAR
ncbi:MAG TPA: glycosyltransferase family 4 protein [Blastocatellia bacterium]|nr:glycosyltransferase family 4 protein [Blastocatellia bacterium]